MSEPDERESAKEADDFHLAEFESDDDEGSAHDPDHSGLELGDAEAAEIRHIFLTTLPQYLEPLEELLEQALAQPKPEATILATLGTTVASILAAAQRIGVDDVAKSLMEMSILVEELAVSDPEELGAELRGMLRKIKEQSGAGDAIEDTSGEARTIVAALGALEGFDTSILESLTAAGLVTVSQLRVARKYEIVAVTGLPEESVGALLEALGIEEAARPPRAAQAREGSELEVHLRAQVEAEDALSRTRAEVQRLRGLVDSIGLEIERAEMTTTALRARENDAAGSVADLLHRRALAKEALARLEATREDLERRARSARGRLSRLEQERARAEREQEALRDQLSELGDRVRSLLATADRAREP
jgi:hypothetical protein